jgi:1-acyl-sn-glycerol-3-phosphate acyltransferase
MARIENLIDRPAWLTLRSMGALITRVDATLHIQGEEHIPRSGPVVLAARHYHHLYDGCALLAMSRRPTHILVANDWAESGWQKRLLATACQLARWPTVSRPDTAAHQRGNLNPLQRFGHLRRANVLATRLLIEGRVLLVFPEGYPTIDPFPTPKQFEDSILPFQSGFVDIAWHAQRHGAGPVPIIPVGLSYQRGERWNISVRFGEPLHLTNHNQKADIIARTHDHVYTLSGIAAPLEVDL